MTFACPTYALDEVLSAAQRFGYGAIEPRLDSGHAHGVETGITDGARPAVRALVADAEIALGCLATSLQVIAPPGEAQNKLQAGLEERARLAADLGCAGLRVFAGPVPEGWSRQQALACACDNLTLAAERLSPLGVQLWLETHDTVSRGADAAAVVRQVDSPLVGINYDILHPLRLGEPLATTFHALDGLIRHSHWHDAKLSGEKFELVPLGEGELPLAEIIAYLRSQRYGGCLSGEWFHAPEQGDPDEALGQFASAMNRLLS